MSTLNEKEYHDACQQLFTAIEELVDTTDADYDNNGNVMEIFTTENEKIIISRQAAMREIWLATRTGGRHFKLVDGEWRDTRDNTTLTAQLHALLN